MGDRHDYVALEWVKGEIAETLKQARHALEEYVENPQDSTRLRFCLTYIHQVHGTLQMVEFFGAALLAEEMEQLAQALLEERVNNLGEALEVLMQAILQLPLYLDRIQTARRDLPMVVLPLLNDLRAARGEQLLSETSLFTPALPITNEPLSEQRLRQLNVPELDVLLRKLRQMLQVALVGVLRGQNLPVNLGYMARVFARLETLSKDAPLEPLWQVAAGLVDGLANGSVDAGASVRTLLRQVDRELRRLVAEQAVGLNQPAAAELIKNLLFYVAKAQPNSARLEKLHTLYRLDEALPNELFLDEERARMSGPDRGAIRSVVAALCEELVRIKDSLDLFVRSDRSQLENLDALQAPLKQIADTLAVLGFAQPRKVVLDQIKVVAALIAGETETSDAVLMDIAGALLYIEATLTGMVGTSDSASNEQNLMPTTDVGQIHRLVIKEARTGLEHAKDGIIEFIASQWDHQHLANVPYLLNQVRGGLIMIPLERAAALVETCRRYIEEQLFEKKVIPNWRNLDTLADAITSVEYYLERLAEDHASQGETILDVAEESLTSLGYAPVLLTDSSDDGTLEAEALSMLDEPLASAVETLPELLAEQHVATASFQANELPAAQAQWLVESSESVDNDAEQIPTLSVAEVFTDNAVVDPSETPTEDVLAIDADDSTAAEPATVIDQASVAILDEETSGIELETTEIIAEQSDAELDEIPEVELAQAIVPTAEHTSIAQMSLQDVMSSSIAPVNPPATDVPPSILPPPADEEPIDEELQEVFVEEVEEVLETLNEFYPQWRANQDDKEALAEVRRAFHTLKGSGRMVRALVAGELAWSIENMLNRVIEGNLPVSETMLGVISDVIALFPELTAEYAAQQQCQRDDVDQLAAAAHALARNEAVPVFATVEKAAQLSAQTPAQTVETLDIDSTDDVTDISPLLSLAEPELADAVTVEDAQESEAIDPILLDIFKHEAQAHVQILVEFLADCAQQLPKTISDDLQRAMHTLKGSAFMAGILPIANIATVLEKLAKDYKANLLAVEFNEALLLSEAEQLLRAGIEQLDTTPLQAIDGTQAFLDKLNQVIRERLAQADGDNAADPRGVRDPKVISTFLSEGMDILLDMDEQLERWRLHPAERQELAALLDELSTLSHTAEMAELPQIEDLCSALLELYSAVKSDRLPTQERFFEQAKQAHDALINMMDQVAAGLQVEARQDCVDALYALLVDELQPLETLETETETETEVEVEVEAVELNLGDESLPELIVESETIEEIQADEQYPPILEVTELTEQDTDELELESVSVEPEPEPELELELEPVSPEPELLLDSEPETEQLVVTEEVFSIAELDEEMVDIFLDEAMDLLESAGESLDAWLAAPENHTVMSALLRDLHTLKGGAGMAEIKPVGDLAHELESLYEGLLDGRYSHSGALADLLLRSHDRLAVLLDQLQAQQAMQQPTILIESMQAFRQAAVVPFEQEDDDDEFDDGAGFLLEAVEPEHIAAPAELPLLVVEASTNEAGQDLPDPELVDIFLEEGFEIIESATAALLRWIAQSDNVLELATLQRDLHTLKGGARMAEIHPIGDLAHELEFLYEDLSAGKLKVGEPVFTLLQDCHNSLAVMLEAVRDAGILADGQALIAQVKQLRSALSAQQDTPDSIQLQPVQTTIEQYENDDILNIFIAEADELLAELDSALHAFASPVASEQAIDDALRALNTLKGGARLAESQVVGDISQQLEAQLMEAQQQGQPWPDSLHQSLRSSYEQLLVEVNSIRQALPEDLAAPTIEQPAMVAQQLRLTTPIVAASEIAHKPVQQSILPFVERAKQAAAEASAQRAPQEQVRVPAELLEGLVNLAGETSIFRGRVEQQVSDFGFTLSEMEATIDRVRDQLRRLDTETQAQILSRHQADTDRAIYEDFDPLEMDRYSQLQQLSRALFESSSDLLDLKETLAARNRDAETLLLQQARVNTELQEGLMRTHMVPFERLLPRLRRVVRQISGDLGKTVNFEIANAEGEVDRSVLERMLAPLEHMLRNAIDHGIESSDARRAAGKPAQGTIRLDLGREGADILLVLSDDGAGINIDAVRKKALERGLTTVDADLTEQEVLQFILQAGFSTAEKVTQISGRGVGMDVVSSEIKQIGGSITIDSQAGIGTRFNIRLPFTVSVNRALMVMAGEDSYAIPLNTIEGIVRVSPFELEALYEQEKQEGKPAEFEYAGQVYQLKYIGDLLNNGQHPKLVAQTLPLPVILVRSNEYAVAVQVDVLAGSREIVVKSLGSQFANVHGISGATILGDGRVVVILDLMATIRLQQTRQSFADSAGQALLPATDADKHEAKLVMVVDDSITVRKVTTRLLERNGMNVLTAKDGVDAIALLQERKPDIMLLDIEMPRMDGFEVATLVRHDAHLKDLPIIMITSRTGEKHRERAMAIGVNDYLGKPYQETVLLEAIDKLIKSHV
ncbi:MAG TPA: response regulator [Gammaproteobacteria bacterium]|nr:response regulator [Gammaproteobacteria bacterium]